MNLLTWAALLVGVFKRIQDATRREMENHLLKGAIPFFLKELEPDRDRQLKYVDFIDIYTALDDNEMKAYEKQYPQETKTMAGLRERLLAEGEQRGVQQGLEQGLERGKATGERAVLLLQLSRRFGPLDEATRHKLESASTEELELWADNVLDAQSLEDVFTRH